MPKVEQQPGNPACICLVIIICITCVLKTARYILRTFHVFCRRGCSHVTCMPACNTQMSVDSIELPLNVNDNYMYDAWIMDDIEMFMMVEAHK